MGERIEGDWNTRALESIAIAFDAQYAAVRSFKQIANEFDCVIAVENTPSARCIYDLRLSPEPGRCAVVVGNEGHGLAQSTLGLANYVVQIPLLSLNLNCLNVASAAAVALHYLTLPHPLAFLPTTLDRIQRRRPSLLVTAGSDHRELGSAIRSACAFGWEHLFLDDPRRVWYTDNRVIRAEGRDMARRDRNPLKVLPADRLTWHDYNRLIRITPDNWFPTLHGTDLTGSGTLICLTDPVDAATDAQPANWHGAISNVYVPEHPDLAAHFRCRASVVLAEIARQLGSPRNSTGIRLRRRADRYQFGISMDTCSGTGSSRTS